MKVPYRGSGLLYYNEKEYDCDLYYSEEQGAVVVKIYFKDPMEKFLEIPLECNSLPGQLHNGFKFTLCKVSRRSTQHQISYGRTVYICDAEKILCGIGGKHQVTNRYYKVDYMLSNIIEWGGISAYTNDRNGSLSFKNQNATQCLFQNDNYTVTYMVSGRKLPFWDSDLLNNTIVLTQGAYIEIKASEDQELAFFDDIFQKTKRLIEISSLQKINLEKMEVYSHEYEQPINVYGYSIKKPKTDDFKKTTFRSHQLISLTDLITNDSFKKYYAIYETIEPVIELFIEPFYHESSHVRTFLNVVQALETYHSRFITNNLPQYQSRVNILANMFPAVEQKKVKSYLTAKSHSFITLQSRIADLLLAERHIIFDTGDISRESFPEVISRTRNYYIHYDETIKNKHTVISKDELAIYNKVLFQILEYYILKEIGIVDLNNTSTIKEKLRNRWGNIPLEFDILRQSRKKPQQ